MGESDLGEWYVLSGGVKKGPYTQEQVYRLCGTGVLKPGDEVFEGAFSEQSLFTVSEFLKTFRSQDLVSQLVDTIQSAREKRKNSLMSLTMREQEQEEKSLSSSWRLSRWTRWGFLGVGFGLIFTWWIQSRNGGVSSQSSKAKVPSLSSKSVAETVSALPSLPKGGPIAIPSPIHSEGSPSQSRGLQRPYKSVSLEQQRQHAQNIRQSDSKRLEEEQRDREERLRDLLAQQEEWGVGESPLQQEEGLGEQRLPPLPSLQSHVNRQQQGLVKGNAQARNPASVEGDNINYNNYDDRGEVPPYEDERIFNDEFQPPPMLDSPPQALPEGS